MCSLWTWRGTEFSIFTEFCKVKQLVLCKLWIGLCATGIKCIFVGKLICVELGVKILLFSGSWCNDIVWFFKRHAPFSNLSFIKRYCSDRSMFIPLTRISTWSKLIIFFCSSVRIVSFAVKSWLFFSCSKVWKILLESFISGWIKIGGNFSWEIFQLKNSRKILCKISSWKMLNLTG